MYMLHALGGILYKNIIHMEVMVRYTFGSHVVRQLETVVVHNFKTHISQR